MPRAPLSRVLFAAVAALALLLTGAGSARAQDSQPPATAQTEAEAPPVPTSDAAAAATAGAAPPQVPFTGCTSRTIHQTLADMAAAPPSSLTPATYVLPGGETTDFEIDRVFTPDSHPVFCAWVVWDDRAIRPRDQWASIETGENTAHGQCKGAPGPNQPFVEPQRADIVSVIAGDAANSTWVRIALPATESFNLNRWCAARLILALYERGADGRYTVTLAFDRVELFSNYVTDLTMVLSFVALVYLTCVAANAQAIRRRMRKAGLTPMAYGRAFRHSLSPVVLTAEENGHASLSNLQVFGFSLLVSALVLFILFRLGTLSSLSPDILYLLGISAVGTAGGKLTDTSRNRLSLENYTWLKRKGWLSGDRVTTKWSQLFTTEGTLDVSKMQMGAFSLIVAIGLAMLGSSDLGTFDIPDTLLGVLGLSQGVYVAGRAVTPPTYGDYDKKLTATREAEARYREDPTLSNRRAYLQNAEQAATMHQLVFGRKIDGADLLQPRPPFPDGDGSGGGSGGGGAGSGGGAGRAGGGPAGSVEPAPTPTPLPAGPAAAAAPAPSSAAETPVVPIPLPDSARPVPRPTPLPGTSTAPAPANDGAPAVDAKGIRREAWREVPGVSYERTC